MGAAARHSRVLRLWVSGLMVLGCAPQRVNISLMPPQIATSATARPSAPSSIVWQELFDAMPEAPWREVEVRRHTQYRVTELDDHRCLEARSHDGASILLHPVQFDPDTYEWLSWDWRVDQLVEGEALRTKGGSDAAARVYVYFDTRGLPWQKRSIDYVWSSTLPVGTLLDSAFSAESKIIVAESGTERLGQWRGVERNLEADYHRAFPGALPDVIAIGVMNDTDNTGGTALAYFDNLHVSKEPMHVGSTRDSTP